MEELLYSAFNGRPTTQGAQSSLKGKIMKSGDGRGMFSTCSWTRRMMVNEECKVGAATTAKEWLPKWKDGWWNLVKKPI